MLILYFGNAKRSHITHLKCAFYFLKCTKIILQYKGCYNYLPYFHSNICKTIFILSALFISFAWTSTSTAESLDEYNKKLSIVLENPDDPKTSFDFAKTAISVGDYRGAIAAFERILKAEPGLSNIRLELGVLYKKVGAFELAEGYIQQALTDPNMPANVRNRAKSLLSSTEDAISPHYFSGNISIAGLYDDNANAGPSNRSIIINGLESILSEDSQATEDFSAELVAAFQYSYDFNSQRGHSFDVDFLTYNRSYDQLSRLDTNLLELKLGPRFRLGPLVNPNLSVQPYIAVNLLFLDQDKYKEGGAIGLNIRKPIGFKTLAEIDLKVEEQSFFNSEERLNAESRSGTFLHIKGKLLHQISARLQVTGKLGGSTRNAEQAFESFDEINAGVAFRYAYSLTGKSKRPWSTSLSLDWRDISYDQADTGVGFAIPREEQRMTARLSNSIPLWDSVSLIASASYTDNESDIVLYDFDNWGGSLGFTFGF